VGTAYGLLRLPKMPELRRLAAPLNFTPEPGFQAGVYILERLNMHWEGSDNG
jgi:hypothetical protein